MKAEKIVISFFAILIGIGVAGAAFYFYQTTKVIPPEKIKTVSVTSATPTSPPSIFLNVENPKNEDVTDSKTITVSGKTTTDAVIVVSSPSSDQVVLPALNGNFSTTTTIENGANQIEITAISPNGEEAKAIRTITFSTESF